MNLRFQKPLKSTLRRKGARAIMSLLGLLISQGPAFGFDGPGGAKGVGPVSAVTLSELSQESAHKGKEIFSTKCSACHKLDERYVGPAVKGITKKRSPEWVMNMILNPVEMTQKDAVAQELLGEFLTQMTFQDVSEADARHVLEYFRWVDEKGDLVANANGGKASEKSKAKTKK